MNIRFWLSNYIGRPFHWNEVHRSFGALKQMPHSKAGQSIKPNVGRNKSLTLLNPALASLAAICSHALMAVPGPLLVSVLTAVRLLESLGQGLMEPISTNKVAAILITIR